MLKINGTGDGMSGRVHPDRRIENIYCDNCKRITPFIKMLGVKRNYIFWIPLPTKEREKAYWQCDECQRFVRFGEEEAKHYSIPGDKGGVMRDLTQSEKNDNLRRLADNILMKKRDNNRRK
jgi:hypothetical protein